MANQSCYCPECRKRVVQLGQDGMVRIRTSCMIFGKGATRGSVICRSCGAEVPLDILMGSSMMKSVKAPRLVVSVQPKKSI